MNLLIKFYRDNQDTAQQIRAAISDQNLELAVRLAHTVKGVSGTIGVHALQSIAGELDRLIGKYKFTEAKAILIELLDNLE